MGLRISLSSAFQNPVSSQVALSNSVISMHPLMRLRETIWADPALLLTASELPLYGSQVVI